MGLVVAAAVEALHLYQTEVVDRPFPVQIHQEGEESLLDHPGGHDLQNLLLPCHQIRLLRRSLLAAVR